MPATVDTPARVPPFAVRQFTVEEYHEMARAGVLKGGAPFELLEGWIVPKMTKNPPHVWAVQKLAGWLEAHLPTGWYVRRQDPITTSESEPEPDLAVARGSQDDYRRRHPSPADLALLVEVADASLAQDRGDKGRIYARADIGVYWIVNLVDGQVEVYSDPSGPVALPSYHQRHDYGVNDTVPLFLEGRQIAALAVRELLP